MNAVQWFLFWQATLASVGIAFVVPLDHAQARARERERLRAAADRQHAWVLAGDPRGIWGDP